MVMFARLMGLSILVIKLPVCSCCRATAVICETAQFVIMFTTLIHRMRMVSQGIVLHGGNS